MEPSDFLGMNLLSNNDYAEHWDVPLNDSLRIADAEFEEIATELLTTPAGGYSGQLRGTHSNLQNRLDSIEDPVSGGLIFNDHDLEKSRYSRKPWTVDDDIQARIAQCEEANYVEDSFKRSISTGAGFVPYARARLDRLSGSGVKGRRYSSGSSVDLDNFYFRNADVTTLITHTGVNEVTVWGLGLMQLGGNLFHHTRSGTAFVTDIGSHTYRVTASPSNPVATIDCQFVRSSVSAGCSGGSFVEGGSTFNSAGAGVGIGDPDVGNNHWRPVAGQILRVDFSGSYYDYVIKSVDPGGASVEIDGKFEIDSLGGMCDWEIYDLTQPCINVTEVLAANTTEDAMQYSLAKLIPDLVIAYIHVEAGVIRVTCPVQNDFINKTMLLQPTYYATGHIGPAPGGTVEDMELEGVAAANIKDVKVVSVERIYKNLATDVYHYVVSVNPKRRVTIGGLDYFLDSFHAVHYQTIESDTGDKIVNLGTIGPGAGNTVIRLVHPDYGDDGATNSYWAYDTDVVAGWPIDGYELVYLGVLVEMV
jgi:hypothetical protein